MKRIIAAALIVVSTAAPFAASAQALTYDFTGTVISSSGIYAVTVGTTITGTYTLDYANANSSQSVGVLGSTSDAWLEEYVGGSYNSTAAPTLDQYVFSSTLQDGSVSYASSGASGAYQNGSFVEGMVSSAPSSDALYAYEESSPVSGKEVESDFFLSNSSAPVVAPWTGTGEPILSNSNSNTGLIADLLNGSEQGFLEYTVTSITPVPLPATAWLLLSALAGLWIAGSRQSAS